MTKQDEIEEAIKNTLNKNNTTTVFKTADTLRQEKQTQQHNKLILYTKIQQAKREFLTRKLKKEGKNNFQHYNYFTIDQIISNLLPICTDFGLATRVFFDNNTGYLYIIDLETGEQEKWQTPIPVEGYKNDAGEQCKQIQAVQTYARRTLYLQAFEIVEGLEIEQEQKSTRNNKRKTIQNNRPPQKSKTRTNNIHDTGKKQEKQETKTKKEEDQKQQHDKKREKQTQENNILINTLANKINKSIEEEGVPLTNEEVRKRIIRLYQQQEINAQVYNDLLTAYNI